MRNESGNVLVIILITVALFAALMFTFTKNSNTGSSDMLSESQAKLAATEIINYSKTIESGVNRLVNRGCSDGEISFLYDWNQDGSIRNDDSGDHANQASPADKSCTVFLPEGASIPWRPRPTMLQASDMHRNHRLNGNSIFIGHGEDDNSELVFTFSMQETEKNKVICNALNKELGIQENIINDANYNFFTYFSWSGSYSDSGTDSTRIIGNSAADDMLEGKQTGCFLAARNGTRYVFYHVVIAR